MIRESEIIRKYDILHGSKLLIFSFVMQVKFFASLSLLEIHRIHVKGPLIHETL